VGESVVNEHPRKILMARYKVVAAQLSSAISALEVAIDLETPFYRGEDCRENHRLRFESNVKHWASRLDEVSLLLAECPAVSG